MLKSSQENENAVSQYFFYGAKNLATYPRKHPLSSTATRRPSTNYQRLEHSIHPLKALHSMVTLYIILSSERLFYIDSVVRASFCLTIVVFALRNQLG